MKKGLKLSSVLADLRKGLKQRDIAEKYEVSESAVSQFLAKLVVKGRIIRKNRTPAIYEVVTPTHKAQAHALINNDGVKEEPSISNTKRVVERHNLGEAYQIVSGKVTGGHEWPMRNWSGKSWKEDAFTILAYPSGKVFFWAKKLIGFSPEQQLVKTRHLLRQRVELFAQEQGVVLKWLKYLGKPEWATTTVGHGLSEELVDGMALRESPKRVGDILFSTDKSHVSKAEMGGTDADKYAQRLHLLVRDDKVFEAVTMFVEFVQAQSKPKLEPDWRDRL